MKKLLPVAALGLILSTLPALAFAPSIQLPTLTFPDTTSPLVLCVDSVQTQEGCTQE